jgi:ferritin-like protein
LASSSAQFHEAEEHLRPATIERHRAIVSLMEELEAIDWYDQRIDATGDDELRSILEHNRDEEKEHASMALEWLRRDDPVLDRFLRQYLFTEGSIAGVEREAEANGGPSAGGPNPPAASLGIGSLRGRSVR